VQFDEKMTISVWVKLHTIGRSYEMYGGPHGAEQVSQKEENTPIKLSADRNLSLPVRVITTQVINCHGGNPGESVVIEANAEGGFWRARCGKKTPFCEPVLHQTINLQKTLKTTGMFSAGFTIKPQARCEWMAPQSKLGSGSTSLLSTTTRRLPTRPSRRCST